MAILNEEYEFWKKDLIRIFVESLCNNGDLKKDLIKIFEYYTSYAPAYIYKYYSDKPHQFENLMNNKMWYSSPVRFNDVFDCDISINKDAIKESIKKLIPEGKGFREGSPAWRDFQKITNKTLKELKNNLEGIKGNYGITCFSESFDSLLMWAHYANNHSGMCVEYELLDISEELKFTPVPVIYSNDRVSINTINPDSINKDIIKIFVDSITSKSNEWQYEREWRIIRDNKACGDKWIIEKGGALLDMIKPHSIILGCMAESEFETKVKSYCKENNVNLYKMEKDEKLFKLIRTPLIIFDEEDI